MDEVSKRTTTIVNFFFGTFQLRYLRRSLVVVLLKSTIKMIQGSAVLIEKKTILLSLDTDRPNIVQLSYNFCLKIFTNLLARRVLALR